MFLEDASTGSTTRVDGNRRAHTQSIATTEAVHEISKDRGYNINTGFITSVNSDSALLYFENGENNAFIVSTLVLGITSGITHSATSYLTFYYNITGGDLISDATAVESKRNRNAGSSTTLSSSNIYKGKNGGTVSGGDTVGRILVPSTPSRSSIPLDLYIPKGSNVAFHYTANVSSGSASVYCALIGYLKDPEGV